MTTVYTVGHGNRSSAEFIGVLAAHQIGDVIDVRAYPGSRYPQFCRAALEAHLLAAGVAYIWEGAALGGMRKPLDGSRHLALKGSVRGYADHMESAAFQNAIARVTTLAQERRVAIMCAEKQPSRCHRSLISDTLTVFSTTVRHLIDMRPGQAHVLSKLARPHGRVLVYDGGAQYPLL